MREMTEFEKAMYDKQTAGAEQGKLDLRDVKVYGYARVSTPSQNLERQITNLKESYPDIVIFQEKYTGTKEDRPEWDKLQRVVSRAADAGEQVLLVFDSVSRMSRDASAGIQKYFELFNKGVELRFLNEPYIDTVVYGEKMKPLIELQGTDEDELYKGINAYVRKLAERQIRQAFEQSEKEVADLRKRTSQGIREKRAESIANGGDGSWGAKKGVSRVVKNKPVVLKEIKKHSRAFGGTLTDAECIKLIGVAPNTYYKYKKELKAKS